MGWRNSDTLGDKNNEGDGLMGWDEIREHYRSAQPKILAAQRNEWAIDPYAWDEAGIRLTPIEQWLWADLRACDSVMYPQYPVGKRFVDFGNPIAKVAIECDGAAFHTDKAKDAARDAELRALGWTTYRIPGYVCRTDSDGQTGAPGQALLEVSRIVARHNLSAQPGFVPK